MTPVLAIEFGAGLIVVGVLAVASVGLYLVAKRKGWI
jgi:hypothetical protein